MNFIINNLITEILIINGNFIFIILIIIFIRILPFIKCIIYFNLFLSINYYSYTIN
jgi:hypothetical protein